MLFTLPDAAINTTIISKELHLKSHQDRSCQLQFLENIILIISIDISINSGLKLSKELQLFKTFQS